MSEWTKVYTSRSLFEAEMVKAELEDNGIQTVLMNRSMSAYPGIGDVEVYCHQDDVLQAMTLLKTHQSNE